ncbi:unnamed protein product, partial [Ilex paraguariensis]
QLTASATSSIPQLLPQLLLQQHFSTQFQQQQTFSSNKTAAAHQFSRSAEIKTRTTSTRHQETECSRSVQKSAMQSEQIIQTAHTNYQDTKPSIMNSQIRITDSSHNADNYQLNHANTGKSSVMKNLSNHRLPIKTLIHSAPFLLSNTTLLFNLAAGNMPWSFCKSNLPSKGSSTSFSKNS